MEHWNGKKTIEVSIPSVASCAADSYFSWCKFVKERTMVIGNN